MLDLNFTPQKCILTWNTTLILISRSFFLKFFIYFLMLFLSAYILFIYVCMYVCMYVWLCWVFVSVWGLSLVVASGGHSSSRCADLSLSRPLVAKHRLQTRRLSNCGSRAELLRGMWDPPRPGLEPASPALAGRLSTTAPPGKPYLGHFKILLTMLGIYDRYLIKDYWNEAC